MMSEAQENEASRFLLALARRNAQAYASLPNTQAILVTGSTARGGGDFYSDLDMIMYYDTLPAREVLLEAYRQNEGQGLAPIGEPGEEAVAEYYTVHGVECQFIHTTVAAWERDMATVLDELDVTSPTQKAISGLLEGLPLYGEPLIRQWQAKLALYPDALAQAMVNHYLTFVPIWGIRDHVAARDATIWVHELLVEIAYNLLGTLAGLNRRYYSSFQFKRMHDFAAQLEFAPPHLADRLEAIFHADMITAAVQVEALVGETVALVEQHMPLIDTSRVRKRLGWRQQPWQLPAENNF